MVHRKYKRISYSVEKEERRFIKSEKLQKKNKLLCAAIQTIRSIDSKFAVVFHVLWLFAVTDIFFLLLIY